MKRTSSILLGLVPVIAAAAACGPSQYTHQRVCVDPRTQQVVNDYECNGGTRGYVPYYMPYRSGGYPLGYVASGGSRFAPSGGYVGTGRSASVARGGFGSIGGGSSASSFGG